MCLRNLAFHISWMTGGPEETVSMVHGTLKHLTQTLCNDQRRKENLNNFIILSFKVSSLISFVSTKVISCPCTSCTAPNHHALA